MKIVHTFSDWVGWERQVTNVTSILLPLRFVSSFVPLMTRGRATCSGVLLDTDEGQTLLHQSERKNQSAFKVIAPSFHKQDGRAVCGYCSAACALSVLKVNGKIVLHQCLQVIKAPEY